QRLRQIPLPGHVEGEHLAFGPLNGPREPGGRLAVGDQGDGGLGWDLVERYDCALDVGLAPALDSIDEQIAARGNQGNRGERGRQLLDVGRAPPVPGLEELERPRSALPLA